MPRQGKVHQLADCPWPSTSSAKTVPYAIGGVDLLSPGGKTGVSRPPEYMLPLRFSVASSSTSSLTADEIAQRRLVAAIRLALTSRPLSYLAGQG